MRSGPIGRHSPRRPSRTLRHLPALDGLRGIAVLGVVAFHLWPGAIPGGWLGVDVFFVLSGFLITRLLVDELGRSGRIAFGEFWGRRARRLLPAALTTITVVAIAARWLLSSWLLAGFRGDALASLGYVANWRFIATGDSYFAAGAPSPLQHLWSLAIEEQFYLVWPMVLLVLWRVSRARPATMAVIALVMATASAVLMAALSGAPGSRAYFGTDTRAQALLIGAATALMMSTRSIGRASARALGTAAPVALSVVLLMMARVSGQAQWMYRGGFALIAVSVAVVLAACTDPSVPISRVLEIGWLRTVGHVSYGLYLWHWPVIVLLTKARVGFGGVALDGLRIAVFSALTMISYHLVEQPIRRTNVVPRWVLLRSAVAVVAVVAVVVAGSYGAVGPPRQLQAAAGSIQTVPARAPRALAAPAPETTSSPVVAVASAPSSTTIPPPLRIGVVGDSIGFTLAYFAGALPGVDISGGGTIGCGVIATAQCANWEDLWRTVGQGDPDIVVVMLGAWEIVADRSADGDYQPGSDEARSLVLDHLEDGLSVLPPSARIAMLDVPCLNQPDDGGPMPADLLSWINGVFSDFANAHPDRVTIVPISQLLCPDGSPDVTIDGVSLRPTGRHFDERSAPLVWQWLLPRLPKPIGR